MIKNTSELIGSELDWAVAECENFAWNMYNFAVEHDRSLPPRPSEYLGDYEFNKDEFKPSSDWATGGPIIERMRIESYGRSGSRWGANIEGIDRASYGPTILVAAMRCYVSSLYGRTIEIPDNMC